MMNFMLTPQHDDGVENECKLIFAPGLPCGASHFLAGPGFERDFFLCFCVISVKQGVKSVKCVSGAFEGRP
jgi:hypothetical protein